MLKASSGSELIAVACERVFDSSMENSELKAFGVS
jgi:hypothetical protein